MRLFTQLIPNVLSLFMLLPFSLWGHSPSEAANAFISSLSEDQQSKVLLDFEDMTRVDWSYLPATLIPRPGLSLKDLNENQQEYLHKLLQVYLSEEGLYKTERIIYLENVLKELENGNKMRDEDLYYVAFYGKPGKDEIWGWQFEGHHVSLNFTVVGEQISFAPLFFGANPAKINQGMNKGLRVLRDEEDIALQLVHSLDKAQKEKAIFQLNAFLEIVTTNASEVHPLEPVGIIAGDLNPEQRKLLHNLILEYINTVSEEVAIKRYQLIKSEEFDHIRFGWAGSTDISMPHYYRIQGKSFLIEFDNTQNNANHIHAVWRDFNGDFGRNLIKEHYQNSKHH
jgi:hypothetical protein